MTKKIYLRPRSVCKANVTYIDWNRLSDIGHPYHCVTSATYKMGEFIFCMRCKWRHLFTVYLFDCGYSFFWWGIFGLSATLQGRILLLAKIKSLLIFTALDFHTKFDRNVLDEDPSCSVRFEFPFHAWVYKEEAISWGDPQCFSISPQWHFNFLDKTGPDSAVWLTVFKY